MTADRQRKSPTSKKTAAKKTPAKKTPAKKSRPASAPRAESRPRPSAAQVAASAAEQLAGLSGKTPEGITGVERTEDGWRVTAEVLEVRRIPETTDVIAQYEIETDDNGSLTAYRRLRRYTRGSAQED